MIKIIKPGYRKEVECIKCGALLSYDEKEDVQKEESKISAGGGRITSWMSGESFVNGLRACCIVR